MEDDDVKISYKIPTFLYKDIGDKEYFGNFGLESKVKD